MAVLVLGRPVVRAGDAVLRPARRMARVLLGMLALRPNRALPLEWIVDGLWPDKPPASAAANVRSHLAELRRLLRGAGPAIETSGDGYALVADVPEVDATHFPLLVAEGRAHHEVRSDVAAARCLARAVGLWRGGVMEGAPIPEVVRPDAAVLDELRVSAVEDLVAVRVALGHHQDLVPVLRGLVVEHPLRERLWFHLVQVLAALGRRGEALAAYQRFTRVLEAELGVRPSADTLSLVETIRRDATP